MIELKNDRIYSILSILDLPKQDNTHSKAVKVLRQFCAEENIQLSDIKFKVYALNIQRSITKRSTLKSALSSYKMEVKSMCYL